ncbi:hypothetical protein E2C01_030362 [Portunus trituberculatus]|uniref:Uncharacterized protein n=1 Tax=Portunus trituberculatus TaxID=210409 RepID=A0A5B7EX39_PORTR|nr:hypothetical protein [Portunus trituberculatus]
MASERCFNKVHIVAVSKLFPYMCGEFPILSAVKGWLRGYIIHKDECMGRPIIRLCDGTKSFLPCCVPDLKLDEIYASEKKSNSTQDSQLSYK